MITSNKTLITVTVYFRGWYWCLVCGSTSRRKKWLFPVVLWEIKTARRNQRPEGEFLCLPWCVGFFSNCVKTYTHPACLHSLIWFIYIYNGYKVCLTQIAFWNCLCLCFWCKGCWRCFCTCDKIQVWWHWGKLLSVVTLWHWVNGLEQISFHFLFCFLLNRLTCFLPDWPYNPFQTT